MSCHYGDISGSQKRNPQKASRRSLLLSSRAGSARSMLLGFVMVALVAIFASIPFVYQSLSSVPEVQAQELPEETNNAQQAVVSDIMNRMFQVNIPSNFMELVTMAALELEGDALFGGEVTFQNEVLFDGQITLEGDVFGSGVNINLNSGQITASNILYSVKAGDGISISDGQTPTITNNDRGSAQSIFKKVKVGGDEAEADGNSDTLEIASGTGISLSLDKDNDKVTITNTLTPGFIQSGSYAVLPSGITSVGIGTNTPGNTVEINSDTINTSGLSFTQLTSSSPVGVGGGKVLSLDSGGRVILVEDQTSTESAETILPATTAGGTLYFNGVDWVGSTNLYHDGGSVGISNDAPVSRLHVNSNLASKIGLIVQGYTSQTANLQEWRNSSGSIMSYIDANGVFNGQANVEGDINPGLTTGSVLFQGTSGIAEDNAAFFWDDSNNRLGIGITTPNAKTEILSTTQQLRLSYNASTYVGMTVTSGSALDFYTGALHRGSFSNGRWLATEYGGSNVPSFAGLTDTNTGLALWNSDKLSLMTGGNHSLVIDASNNVGIGTSSPNGRLHVVGTADDQQLIVQGNGTQTANLQEWQNSSGTVLSSINANGVFSGSMNPGLTTGSVLFQSASGIAQDNAAFFWDDSTDRLGIGTSSPQRTLHVGSASNSDVYMRVSGSVNNLEGLDIWHSYGGGDVYFDSRYAHANGDFYFRTQTAGTPVNALTIKGSGAVGIGTTSPSVALHVVSTTETLRIGYDASNYTSMRTDSTGNFYIDPTNAGNAIYFGTGNLAIQGNATPQINATNANIIMQNATFNTTSGTQHALSVNASVTPTSGTLIHNTFTIMPTINQTGGANGITRGIYINPTLTAAANWRGLEIANNSGFALYQSGSDAINYIEGRTGIGTTAPTSKLHVEGGYAGNALVRLNNTFGTDILAASASGSLRLRVENSGQITHSRSSALGTVAIDSRTGNSVTLSGITNGRIGILSSISPVETYTLNATYVGGDFTNVALAGIAHRTTVGGDSAIGVLGIGNGGYQNAIGGRFAAQAYSALPAYGVRTAAVSFTGANGYGLYIDSGSGAGTNWGLYQAGSSDVNYMAGRLTIGSTSSSSKFQVVGSADELQAVIRANATQTSDILQIQNSSGTSIFEVDGAGRLAVGGVSTGFDFQLYGSSAMRWRGTSGSNRIGSIFIDRQADASTTATVLSASATAGNHVVNFGGSVSGNYAATVLAFWTAADVNTAIGTERMRIDSGGDVGIGQADPQVKLHVGSTSVADGSVLLRLQDADSQCDFTANAGSPSCGSDLTLKKNVSTLDVSTLLSKVSQLRPVSYNWNTDGDSSPLQFGFIAQEVAEQFPELVTDGTWNDGTTRKFLNMGGLMPYVVGAIGQQQVQIAGLQASQGDDVAFQEWLALREITGVARWNYDAWTFLGEVVFERPVRFLQNVEFLADLNVGGRILHGDRDAAGVARMQAGAVEMSIIFDRAYSVKPIVTLTPEGESPAYYLRDVGLNGFTIVLAEPVTHEIAFNWNVTATKTLRQDQSGAPIAGPSPTPELSPVPSPVPTPALSPSPSPSPTPSPEGEGSPSAELEE